MNTIKITRVLPVLILLTIITSAVLGQKKKDLKLTNKVFCFVHPTIQRENYYLVMKDSFQGRMHGTTDLVDDVREGYKCGYYLVDMKHIRYQKDSIYFTLYISGQDVFEDPIPLYTTNSKKARSLGYTHWKTGSCDYLFGNGKQVKKEMAGKIAGDSISFFVPWLNPNPTKAKMIFFRVNSSSYYFD